MTTPALTDTLRHLLAGKALSRESARATLDQILNTEVPAAQTAALLSLLQMRGPRAQEIAGFADSLLDAAIPFPRPPEDGIDTCGTGGDGKNTFNISTASALVAAAAGAKVFKHGNRAATSQSGSADLLEQLGVPVEQTPETAANQVGRCGFTFLYARQYHPILVKVAGVRSTIGFPTVFNLLGPLLNPAGVKRQVIGVYAPPLQDLVAQTLALRETRHALVIHGAGGLDEATPIGPFRTLVVKAGEEVREEIRDPTSWGLKTCRLSDLTVQSARESRAKVAEALSGTAGPERDSVVLNAAMALEVAGVVASPQEGLEAACQAIDTGAVETLLSQLRSDPAS